MSPMNFKRRVLAALIGVVAIASGAVYAWRWNTPRRATLRGVLASIDLETRSGELDWTNPRSGESVKLRGELAPGCQIRVGDRAASITDLKAGDRVQAEGLLYRSGRVVATSVVVQDGPAADLPGGSRPVRGAAGENGRDGG